MGRVGTIAAKVPLREALQQRLMERVGEIAYVKVNRDGVLLFNRPKRPLAVELEAF
jgi:hypothetical protein